ncbi:MAG: ABC transporter permease [Bacteroidia bacterium]|nr:ABC transporter permease [Bacteroidia bacterium]
MNLNIINIIIKREYLNRVKKKSFLLITFLGPIFFAAMCILPTLIMVLTKEESKKVAVCDGSGIVLPYLEDRENIFFTDCSGIPLDSLKNGMKELGYDVVLGISPLDSVNRTVYAESFSAKPLGMEMSGYINDCINEAVENYRIASYGIENLAEIMAGVKSDVRLQSFTIDESGKEQISASEVYMMVSMVLGIIIYMFIALFGAMVMSSVIEEKSSRVVEVLVSSVKATELMFGKILGIALVALTQFLLWVVLTAAIVGIVGGAMGTEFLSSAGDSTEMMSMMSDPTTAGAVEAMQSSGASTVLSTLAGLNYGQILIAFVLFFIFGYLLYASLFAAIGSAVESEGDTQQLQLPATIPLLIAFFISLYAFRAPDSSVVFWGSMIPFTSPIVMLARIPFGVPMWELALSLLLLILTFVACAWASAKIYKVGILMYGKKSTFKDLWKWLKQN